VVLTAAHCGTAISRIMVGGNVVQPLDGAGRIVSVRKVVVHPSYRSGENDITVLILAEDAEVPPVKIATEEQLRAATNVQLVGFGFNDPSRQVGFGTKRQVVVPMAPVMGLAGDPGLQALEQLLGFHAAYEFVAGRKGLGLDTCNGDSGGPAYILGPQNFLLAGLTSRATRQANLPCGDGGIYVRPDRFRDWIAGVLSEAGLPAL
jgi:endonuclease G